MNEEYLSSFTKQVQLNGEKIDKIDKAVQCLIAQILKNREYIEYIKENYNSYQVKRYE